jgi:hypothetical protein
MGSVTPNVTFATKQIIPFVFSQGLCDFDRFCFHNVFFLMICMWLIIFPLPPLPKFFQEKKKTGKSKKGIKRISKAERKIKGARRLFFK